MVKEIIDMEITGFLWKTEVVREINFKLGIEKKRLNYLLGFVINFFQ
jgi:hypothetical protein